jgi:hypothetical protein
MQEVTGSSPVGTTLEEIQENMGRYTVGVAVLVVTQLSLVTRGVRRSHGPLYDGVFPKY